jgi:hypothetical protein
MNGEQLLEINGVDLCVETFVPALIRHTGRGRS